MKRKFAWGLGALLAIALLFPMRAMLSWRPKSILGYKPPGPPQNGMKQILLGLFGPVERFRVSPDNKSVALIRNDRLEWVSGSGSVQTFDKSRLVNFAFSPDSQKLALIYQPGTHPIGKIVDETGSSIALKTSGADYFSALHFSPNGKMLTLASPHSVVTFNVQTGESLCHNSFLRRTQETLSAQARLSPEGRVMLTFPSYSDLSAYDLTSRKALWTIQSSWSNMKISERGNLLAVGQSQKISVFSLTSGQKQWTVDLKTTPVTAFDLSFEFSNDGRDLITTTDGNVHVLDARTGQFLRWLPLPPNGVSHLHPSPKIDEIYLEDWLGNFFCQRTR